MNLYKAHEPPNVKPPTTSPTTQAPSAEGHFPRATSTKSQVTSAIADARWVLKYLPERPNSALIMPGVRPLREGFHKIRGVGNAPKRIG
ncbi:hypothetical protein [uncultured Hymenobacter sp.]|uniref:hypothetical protein n=1 Tax=uncultured Hymenobacter sp. TaxID=170016 RepID=UPI0035CAEF50